MCTIMDKLKVISYNARGLAADMKRRKIFNMLRKSKADIVLLQECHSEAKSNSLWSTQWGNKVLFANGTSNSRGVAILFNKKSAGYVTEVRRDEQGRFLLCKMEMGGYTYCVGNIYAPNNDNPTFFRQVFTMIEEMDCVYVILGGDFNTVMDPKLDRSTDVQYHKQSWDVIQEKSVLLDLVDIWRVRNPVVKKFTWHKYDHQKKAFQWSRIDFFLVSAGLSNQTTDCEITPGVLSDHSVISIQWDTGGGKWGPGYWKCNNELLNDQGFCEAMEKDIEHTKTIFSHLDAKRLWEMIKFEISNMCKEYTLVKGRKEKDKLFDLYRLLSDMQEKVITQQNGEYCNQTLQDSMVRVRQEIDSYEETRTKKAAF